MAVRRLRLMLRPWQRLTFAITNVLPIPGVGAMIAGTLNPHTTLRRNGLLQLGLVLLSYPLIVPGVVGLTWAVVEAIRIHGSEPIPLPPKSETVAV